MNLEQGLYHEVKRLCPLLNFSSQLKHNLFSWWINISSGVKRLIGKGGGWGGEGNNGWGSVWGNVCDGGGGEEVGLVLPQKEQWWSSNFSSWSRANDAAWTNVSGYRAWTSRRMSGVRPETNQLRRNNIGNLIMRLASVSNCERYLLIVPEEFEEGSGGVVIVRRCEMSLKGLKEPRPRWNLSVLCHPLEPSQGMTLCIEGCDGEALVAWSGMILKKLSNL